MRLWPLVALLFGLSACFRGAPPSPIATLPNIVPADSWRAVQPRPGIHVALSVPATIMAKAALIQGRVSIANSNPAAVAFTAPSPCRIENWKIVDAKGKVIAAKQPALCAQVVQTLTLQPGQQVAKMVVLPVNPDALRKGRHYRVLFHFWGEPGETSFRTK